MKNYENSAIFSNNSYSVNHYRQCAETVGLTFSSNYWIENSYDLDSNSNFRLAKCGCEKNAGLYGVVNEELYIEFIDDFNLPKDCKWVDPVSAINGNSSIVAISWVTKIKKLSGKRNTVKTLILDVKNKKIANLVKIPIFKNQRDAANFPQLEFLRDGKTLILVWVQNSTLHFSLSRNYGLEWTEPKQISTNRIIYIEMNEISEPKISSDNDGYFRVSCNFREGQNSYLIDPETLEVINFKFRRNP